MRKIRVSFIIVVIMLAGVIFGGMDILPSLQRTKEATITAIPIQTDSKTSFRTFSKQILECTKNGARMLNLDLKVRFSDAFSYENPVIAEEEDMTGICDLMGKNFRVYNKDGLLYKINTTGVIANFSINKLGQAVVIVNNGDRYNVKVYSEKGEEMYEVVFQVKNIYPIAADISGNGRVLAISSLNLQNSNLTSSISFFSRSDSGNISNIDNMFYSVDREDAVIPVIKAVDDDKFLASSDSEIILFSTEGSGSEIFQMDMSNQITNIGIAENGDIICSLGDKFSATEGMEAGSILWINKNGKVAGDYRQEGDISRLYIKGNQVVAVYGREYVCLSGGKELWRFTATYDMDLQLFAQSKNALMILKNEALIVDMDQFIKEGFETP